jgi:hypothetical protein
MSNQIIAFAGKKESGKSTAAELVRIIQPDHKSVCRLSFADPLKEMVEALLFYAGASLDELDNDKELFIPAIGASYRELCQSLGNDWARKFFNPVLCVNLMAQRIDELDGEWLIIIDDVRYKNEADFIRDQGGLLVHIETPSHIVDTHESEAGFHKLSHEPVVINHKDFRFIKDIVEISNDYVNGDVT